jgi:Pyridoxal-dependent decarboxylase, C-terminal sheet domain
VLPLRHCTMFAPLTFSVPNTFCSVLFCFVRYGAQHPIVVLKNTPSADTGKFVVVGHCCESGDLFSCAPGEPEVIAERLLTTPQVHTALCRRQYSLHAHQQLLWRPIVHNIGVLTARLSVFIIMELSLPASLTHLTHAPHYVTNALTDRGHGDH